MLNKAETGNFQSWLETDNWSEIKPVNEKLLFFTNQLKVATQEEI